MRLQALTFVAVGLLIAAISRAELSAQDDAAQKDLQKLQGDWTMLKGEEDGKSLPDEVIKNSKLTVKGDKHDARLDKDVYLGKLKLDPTQNPKALTTSDTEGRFAGKTMLGIYKIEEGRFTVCSAPPGKDRPKQFSTETGTGHILLVWKRKTDGK